MCEHLGSGVAKYNKDTKKIHYTITCETCKEELQQVKVQAYEPKFKPTT